MLGVSLLPAARSLRPAGRRVDSPFPEELAVIDPPPPAALDAAPAAGETTAAAPPPGAADDPTRTTQQQAYLLQQLADAPGRALARGQANRKIVKAAAETLALDAATADRLRDALVAEGHVRT